MKVAIAGAGNVGTYIAADLKDAGHDVMVIEQDPDLVARLRDDVAVTWVVGDACEVTTLYDAGITEDDVMVAVTGDDEDNLVISLLAKQEFAVPRVVARVNHPKNEWLFNESWGVDVAVSSPRLLAAVVEEAVSVGDLVRLLTFRQGQANLVEVTLPEDTDLAGQPVRSLDLPGNAALVTILRGKRVIVPQGDDALEAGDELLFVVQEDREDELERMLAPTEHGGREQRQPSRPSDRPPEGPSEG